MSTENSVDDVIQKIANLISADEQSSSVADNNREHQVKQVFEMLSKTVDGEGIETTYELHEPYGSMGSVTIVGKTVKFNNPEIFNLISHTISNFEIYPKTNGTVQIDFGFHGLTRKEGEK